MTLCTRSRIFWGHFGLKTAPRFSGPDPLASAPAAAFFRPLLGRGAVWLGPASGITGTGGVAGGGADTFLAREARPFLAGGVLAGGSEVAAALEERGGCLRVLFAGGMASGNVIDGGPSCWLMVICGWSIDEGVKTTNSPFRWRLLRTIYESYEI